MNSERNLDFGFVDMSGQEFALHLATKQLKQTGQSNVNTAANAIKAEDMPVKNREVEFQLPFSDGDRGGQCRKPGQAATTASSSLMVANQKRAAPLANRKSRRARRKRKLTYAEMIGCYVLIEPLNSIVIRNKMSGVVSGDTGRVRPKRKSRGASEQRPNSVDRNKTTKSRSKEKATRRWKKLESNDRWKKNNSGTKCHICQKEFPGNAKLRIHVRLHTGEKPYECQVCKKTFCRSDQLRSHGRIHTGKSPYKCQVCQKTFSQLSNLKVHSTVHTGEKPYECQVCKKTFSRLYNFKCHSRIHTDERPYKCRVCDMAFSQSFALKAHADVHSSDKPYECRVCEKTFTHLAQLKFHCARRAGQKPHQCKVCRRKFSNLCSLRRHSEIQTGRKVYECRVCNKTFSQLKSLKNESVEGATCPPCSKMRSEGKIGIGSDETESKFKIKPDPDSTLIAGQSKYKIGEDNMSENGRNEDPSMCPRPIKEEIIESEVDTTEFVTEDEHFVFLDEKMEFKLEVDEAVESSAALDFGVTVKQEVE